MGKILFFDVPNMVVTNYGELTGDGAPMAASIRFSPSYGTPIFEGPCIKGSELFWEKIYLHSRIYLQTPGTVIYIRGFQDVELHSN